MQSFFAVPGSSTSSGLVKFTVEAFGFGNGEMAGDMDMINGSWSNGWRKPMDNNC